ncbi:MAG: septum formation initiator family protein [Actinomycetota bacterium]
MSSRAQPLPRGRSRPRLTARAGILFALVLLVGVLSIVPLRQFLAQRGEVAQLQRDTRILREANAALEDKIARLNDPKELERLARECLGMVRPGETAFVTVPKHGEPVPTDC